MLNVRTIDRHLLELDEKPLLGNAPPFPIEEVARALESRFSLSKVKVETSPPSWKSGDDYADWMKGGASFSLAAPPLNGVINWVMTEQDGRMVMGALLGGDRYATALSDTDLHEAVCHFVALEVMAAAKEVGYPEGLSLHLLPQPTPIEGEALAIDVTITVDDRVIVATLLLSASFCQAWRDHYRAKETSRRVLKLRSEVELPLDVQVGQIALSKEEWSNLSPGDFIALDTCTIDPATGEGTALLSLEDHPLLQGELTPQGIKIQSSPDYHEVP